MLKHFIMLTIRPYAIRFERAINTQILSAIEDFDLLLEFALEGLLRGDPEKQAKMNALYRGWGILDADEIRQRDLGMNPLPDGLGRVRLAPLNHAPLEMVAGGANLRNSNQSGNRQRTNDRETEESEEGQQQQAAIWDPAHFGALARIARSEASEPANIPVIDEQYPVNGSYSRTVVERLASRMILKEVTAIRGRVRQGPEGFLPWVESFYEKFQSTMAEELSVACDGISDDAGKLAQHIANGHVAGSRDMLLVACECQPEAFADSVNSCVASWTSRKIDWDSHVQEVLECCPS